MGWTNRIDAPMHQASSCKQPDPKAEHAAVGSTWRCDVCSREWRYDGQQPDNYNTTYPKWTEVLSGASDPATLAATFHTPR